MKPYESSENRLHALYQIPTAPSRNRVLEVCCGRPSILLNATWPGTGSAVYQADKSWSEHASRGQHQIGSHTPLPFAPASFDIVILHKTVDDLCLLAAETRAKFDPLQFIAGLCGLLSPGGVMTGCASNAGALKYVLGSLGLGRTKAGSAQRDAYACLTAGGWSRLLQQAGLADARIFTLLPEWRSPLRLVETDFAVSKIAFSNELEATRPALGRFNYLLRRVVVEMGVYRHLEPSLFFWGYKPC